MRERCNEMNAINQHTARAALPEVMPTNEAAAAINRAPPDPAQMGMPGMRPHSPAAHQWALSLEGLRPAISAVWRGGINENARPHRSESERP